MDITVVIPTRNRAKMLADLLDSLKAQKANSLSWEVLVIDNDSTDDTTRVIEARTSTYPVPLRYVHEPNIGLHNCRNRGTMEASGTVVAFLDDDMVVDGNWIQGAIPILEGQASLTGGKILPLWETAPPDWIQAFYSRFQEGTVLGYLGLIDLGDIVKPVMAHHLYGGNCFVRKDVIIELKGYHPDSLPPELIRFRGDGESGFNMKFVEKKLVSLYVPVALVYHRINCDRLTIDYFCRRAFNQGITSSFTKIRQEHQLYAGISTPLHHSPAGLRKLFYYMKTLVIAVIIQLQQIYHLLLLMTSRVKRIRRRIKKSHEKGFAFHQKEVKKDPGLLEWVLRQDYWGQNGILPV